MAKVTKPLGTHAIFDLEFPIDSPILKGGKLMTALMQDACVNEGATIIKTNRKKFTGGGFTFFLLLAESHASGHTWPEYGMATLDIFMCGDCDAHRTMDEFVKHLRTAGHPPTKYIQTKMARGFVCNEDTDSIT
jgi:S-adenosylmethionine decarboxylase proenzyme